GDIELASIGIPTLILGGTADITTPIDPESTRPWSLLPAHPRFRVDILDGGHQSFSDICVIADALLSTGIPPDVIDFLLGNVDEGCAPELIAFEEAHRLSRLYVVAFLKRYVANELQYRRFLNSGYANSHDLPVDFFQGTANGQPGENTP
ncbi:MAG: hypothetical protein OES99_12755, partial [Gammaproteobacteria bacterium]|nr:hypothetical protein [Gammaproteobacteria bacterium]